MNEQTQKFEDWPTGGRDLTQWIEAQRQGGGWQLDPSRPAEAVIGTDGRPYLRHWFFRPAGS